MIDKYAENHFIILSKDEKYNLTEKDLSAKNISYEYILNNERPLPMVYNDALSKARKSGVPKHIYFVHGDVWFNVNSLIKRVSETEDKYDIVGLCGCEKIQVSISPLNWFSASRNHTEFRWGCVTHGELNNSKSFFNASRPEVKDHQVVCIDGLCIIFNKTAIDSGITFEESLKFNCYDTDISLNAILNYKLKLGVIVCEELKHYSVGKSILSNDFLKDEIVLREKYNFSVPTGSRLEEFIKNNVS